MNKTRLGNLIGSRPFLLQLHQWAKSTHSSKLPMMRFENPSSFRMSALGIGALGQAVRLQSSPVVATSAADTWLNYTIHSAQCTVHYTVHTL